MCAILLRDTSRLRFQWRMGWKSACGPLLDRHAETPWCHRKRGTLPARGSELATGFLEVCAGCIDPLQPVGGIGHASAVRQRFRGFNRLAIRRVDVRVIGSWWHGRELMGLALDANLPVADRGGHRSAAG